MKKTILALSLISSSSWASGTFGVSQEVLGTHTPNKPTFNLSIYESISSDRGLYYQSWTGLKVDKWLYSDHALQKYLSEQLSFGIGPSLERQNGETRIMLKVNAQYRLW